MYDFLVQPSHTIEWGDSSLYNTLTTVKLINYEMRDVQNMYTMFVQTKMLPDNFLFNSGSDRPTTRLRRPSCFKCVIIHVFKTIIIRYDTGDI